MTTNDLDTSRLLLSSRLDHITTDPFCFFYVDDYLPADLFQTLLADFPDDSHYAYNAEGKKGFRSSVDPEAIDRFSDEHPAWRQLLTFFLSDEFIADARETFAQDVRKARGLTGRRPWYNCTHRKVPNNWLRYQFQEPVRATFEFSKLDRDAVVVPHSDAPRKLMTLLLYFRDPQWQDGWGGDTEFYAPIDPTRARSWSKTERIPFEEFKPIGSGDYVANRLAGFIRSDVSYHGVRPLACPPGSSRKALMINIKRLKWAKRHKL